MLGWALEWGRKLEICYDDEDIAHILKNETYKQLTVEAK